MKLLGTGGHNRLDGGLAADEILGGAGHDTLEGGNGNDTLDGGTGNDVLSGSDGHDSVSGGTGSDSLLGGFGDDILLGGDGADLIHGGPGRDRLDGGAGNDLLYGETGDALIDGGAGHDIGFMSLFIPGNVAFSVAANLSGTVTVGTTQIRQLEQVCIAAGNGHDTLIGGGYDDTLDGGDGFNVLDGGGGQDVLFGGGDDDRLTGGSGHDTILATAGNDTLRGDSGEDLLTGGAGDDLIEGGAGVDTAVYSGNIANYYAWRVDGGIALRDLRPNADGTDTLVLVDRLAFADGTVTVSHMLSRGRAPVAQADVITVSEDGVAKVNVLANDSDDDGDTLSLVSVTAADPNLSVAFTRAGQVTVTPGAAYQALGAGQSLLTTADVVIRDPYGNTRHSALSIIVTGANDAPKAANDARSIGADAGPTTINVLANDRDPDANAHLFVSGLDLGSTFGAVTINGDGTLSYDPGRAFQYLAAGEWATDSFAYTVSDGYGGQSTATVTVTIAGADDQMAMAVPDAMAGWDMAVWG